MDPRMCESCSFSSPTLGMESHQARRVGVLGVFHHVPQRADLCDPAGVHDRHPVGHLRDDPHVVGDQA